MAVLVELGVGLGNLGIGLLEPGIGLPKLDAGLLQLLGGPAPNLPAESGGILGQVTGRATSGLFGQLANLILFVIFMLSVTLATGLSWFAVMDRIGVPNWIATSWYMAVTVILFAMVILRAPMALVTLAAKTYVEAMSNEQ